MRKIIFAAYVVFAALFVSCGGDDVISKNSYRYNGKEFPIVWSGYDEHMSNGTLRLILSPIVPISNDVPALGQRVEIYIPEGGFGVPFNLRNNNIGSSGRTNGWFIYCIDRVSGINFEGNEASPDTDDISSGTMIVSKTGANSYTVNLSVKFTNGKSLLLNYSGDFTDATTILEMPEGEGNMSLYNSSSIAWGGFIERENLTTIILCSSVPTRNTRLSEMLGGVFLIDVPSTFMNSTIYPNSGAQYIPQNGIPPWRFVYNGSIFDQIKFGGQEGSDYPNETVSGVIDIERTDGTDSFKLFMNIQFTDYSQLLGHWEGTLVDIEGLDLPLLVW